MLLIIQIESECRGEKPNGIYQGETEADSGRPYAE